MNLQLTSARAARFLFGVPALLVLAYVVTRVFYVMGHQRLFNMIPLFDLNRERSIPTWFSSVLLLSGAILAAAVAAHVRESGLPYFAHWTALSLGFAILSSEEIAGLHEMLALPIRLALGTSGLLYYAWIIPFTGIVLLVFLAYLKFLAHLPRRLAVQIILAGALYVGGSIGFEAVGGMLHEIGGIETPLYMLTVLMEEGMEMFGAALFSYAMLEHLARLGFEARLRVAPDPAAADARVNFERLHSGST